MMKIIMRATHVAAALAMISIPAIAHAVEKAPVKLSRSGICHSTESSYYEKTRNFTAFPTLQECLKHGRLPRGSNLQMASMVDQGTTRQSYDYGRANYDREAFGGWADQDGDCVNTRHELLQSLSTAVTRHSKSGCYVETGRWIDPYTDKIFTSARQLDVDHLVPLAYAWSRGADKWSSEKRVQFANDPANLFAVDAATNRAKGPKGPTEWMPPSRSFHCQYVLRFQRISKKYDLQISRSEMGKIKSVQDQVCG